jgi:glycosyltransferase involved in cell wall biosynthesis
MAPSLPLISVVLLAGDDERHVGAALESVSAQDYPATELLIVDGSRDRTGAIVRAFAQDPRSQARFERVVVLDGAPGSGPEAANQGIRESRGVSVALLNGDERLLPRRLTRMSEVCRASGAEIAFSRVEPLHDGSPAAAEIEYVYSVQDNIEFFPTVGYALLRHQSALSRGNLFFSRALFDRVGPFAAYEHAHDWDFLLRCLLVTEPAFVAEPLYGLRLRGHEGFMDRQRQVAKEAEAILRTYFFYSRTRPLTNAVAPSPAWGPFFASFVTASRHGNYLVKP